jgi:GT2 family glycosyltransferase
VGQTFASWSLHVSEDGPGTSEVARVVASYTGDPRISYTATGTSLAGSGLGNKNRLLRLAAAPYVALLDDDDRWGPGFLERRVAFLDVHPECGMVFSTYVTIDASGRETGRSQPIGPEGVYPSSELVPRLLRHAATGTVAAPTVLVRREAYDAVGGQFDERFPHVYDLEMWFRIAVRFPVGFLHSWDAAYRFHEGQSTIRVRSGGHSLLFLEHADALLAREAPALRLPRHEFRRQRSGWLLSVMLDELEAGKRRAAAARLRAALREYPAALVTDKRALPGVLGLVLGRRVARAIAGPVREFVRRYRFGLHRSSGIRRTSAKRARDGSGTGTSERQP